MTQAEKHQEYIEELADDQILPELKQRPGDKLTITAIKKITGTVASDNSVIEALEYLEAGGEVISFEPTPNTPKKWAVPAR